MIELPSSWSPEQRTRYFYDRAVAASGLPSVQQIARAFARLPLSEQPAAVLWFVQRAVRFENDPDDRELVREADETLREGVGDCEDSAIALCALLMVLGFSVGIEWLPQPLRARAHVVARVMIAGAWQWADASIKGARIGEHPYAARERVRVAPALE